MISFEKARQILLDTIKPLSAVRLPILEAGYAVLAENIIAARPIPGFNSAAMDGFGIRCADVAHAGETTPAQLRIIGELPAGSPPAIVIKTGEAVKIFTGAAAPDSIDSIVMREAVQVVGDCVQVDQPVVLGQHIRRCGEEFAAGATVLQAGTLITPPVIGLLAGQGHESVLVHTRPRVAIVVSGSEVRPVGDKLLPGQIYDGISYLIHTALTAAGITAIHIFRAADEPDILRRTLQTALAGHDVVITSGGISGSDYDLLPSALASLEAQILYRQIAIKPGKPNLFGVAKTGQYIFGLPGNPVAAALSYYKLVMPALQQLCGLTLSPILTATATLSCDLKKQAGRIEFVRVKLHQTATGLVATPTRHQGAHTLSGLTDANGLLCFSANATSLSAGQSVSVEWLNWR